MEGFPATSLGGFLEGWWALGKRELVQRLEGSLRPGADQTLQTAARHDEYRTLLDLVEAGEDGRNAENGRGGQEDGGCEVIDGFQFGAPLRGEEPGVIAADGAVNVRQEAREADGASDRTAVAP